jgi:nuclear transport factor 2 (NTF2) superfamily protein
MNAIEVARRYLDAWNRHDADTIAAAFAEGSTYHNPNMDQPLSGGPSVGRWA